LPPPRSTFACGKALCDKLDPIHRLVSVAQNYGKFPEVKQVFDQGGLDSTIPNPLTVIPESYLCATA
jgi:hypothetical protein